MLRFEVYSQGTPVRSIELSGAYMFSQDNIPVRADFVADSHILTCRPSTSEICGLAILFPAGKAGRYLINTTRLPQRKKNYVLNLELARARMRELYVKRMEWALFDFEEASELNTEFDELRQFFANALSHDIEDPPLASIKADEVLSRAMILGEKYALLHSDILSRHRVEMSSTGLPSGCCVNLGAADNKYYVAALKSFCDYINIPLPWNLLCPEEGQYDFTPIDIWMNMAARENKGIHAGPIIDFDEKNIPEWLAIYKHDYPSLREIILSHIKKVVSSYKSYVRVWNVLSGINSLNTFNLNFEQISEIVRTCCLLVKQLSPQSQVMIEMTTPWSEFYAHDTRTIPTFLFADMVTRSEIAFDSFGLRLMMGVATEGMYVRDMMQISSLLDNFAYNGKSVFLTMCGVPSSVDKDKNDCWGGEKSIMSAGSWHGKWCQRLQAEWLHAVCRLALSKTYIQGLCWADVADISGKIIPHGGLRTKEFKPKLALREMMNLRDAWKDIAALGDI